MTISFVRIDDRMIHGQTVTRWAKEYPCDGLVAVNNAAAGNAVLKQAYKAASDKKTFVWTKEAWKEKSQKVLDSDSRYFLITKNPIDMKEILVDQGFVPDDIKEIIVGPALEAIQKAGYKVKFQLLPDVSIGYWDDFKSKFGF